MGCKYMYSLSTGPGTTVVTTLLQIRGSRDNLRIIFHILL